jgi:hypothetical protein
MTRKILVLILVLILTIVLLLYPRKEKNARLYCKMDEDCAPVQCCHSTDCVNVDNKPDCKGIMCTMECRSGTMDCGQGHCACVNNECKAIV